MGLFDFLFRKRQKQSSTPSFTRHDQAERPASATDWQGSKAHQLLLSRFLQGMEAAHAAAPHWARVLGEQPQDAIRRFIAEGILIPASLAGKLDRVCKVSELKPLLKARGLPVTGKKDALIDRLLSADPEGMAEVVKHCDLVECSPTARIIAERYLAEQRAEKAATEEQTLSLLRQKEFRAASQAVAAYEARQVFPRGIGIDWSQYPSDNDFQMLRRVFTARPSILAGLAESDWDPLRLATGMQHLWGERNARMWLPEHFAGIPRFDHDTAARMLLFNARHACNLEHYRAVGVKDITILGCGENSCPTCRAMAGRVMPIDQAPELPHPACTHELGCRCHLVAEFGH